MSAPLACTRPAHQTRRPAPLRLVLGTLLSGLLAAASLPALAQAPADQERERLRVAREQTEARYRVEEADCHQRFAVTGCVDQAKTTRRDGLRQLRREEAVLDTEVRRQRAADRLRAIDDNHREAAKRQPSPLGGSAGGPETPGQPVGGSRTSQLATDKTAVGTPTGASTQATPQATPGTTARRP